MKAHFIPADSVDRLIADRLPRWLVNADVDQIRALHQAMRREQQLAVQVASHFGPLPSIEAFAAPLLVQALRQVGLPDADVRAMGVQIEQTIELPAVSPKLLVNRHTYRSRQSLLAAALHNFHAEELIPDLLRQAWLIGADDKRLPLSFEAFVRCCRTLDLGGRYQRLLATLLAPKDRPTAPAGSATSAVQTMLESNLEAQMEVAMRLARLKGELEDADFNRLLPLWTPVEKLVASPGTATPRQLYLLGKRIQGVATLEQREVEGGALRSITLWIVQDPVAPVTCHASWEALYRWLGTRLRSARYRRFFTRFIGELDRTAFVHALVGALKAAPTGTAPQLDGRHLAIDAPLIQHLRQLQVSKMREDARVLAVPTGDEDLASRHARLQAALGAGLDLLSLAALFVPGLGEVMLVVSAAQIAEHVYEGYEDWRIGDRQGALDHLFAVGEMVAVGAVSGAAGQAAMGALKRVAFVDELVPALGSTGQLRLLRGEPSAHALAEPGELLRHLGGAFAETPDWQAEALLQVTDLSADRLRRLQVEGAPPLARLHDAHERMTLHAQSPTLRGAAFEIEQARLQAPLSSDEALLIGVFPSLSKRQAAEILEHANSAQLAAMQGSGRIPLGIAEQARWAIRDAHLDRACLGLHVEQAGNADTARLALGLLDRSAPWPSDTGVQIREGSDGGAVVASTAHDAGANLRTIVRTPEGYVTRSEQAPLQATHAQTLWQALLSNLEPAHRQMLGRAVPTEETLRAWLAEQAAGDRQRCAEVLGMAPIGVGVRPPMRLADGRLGYPLSGRLPGGRQTVRSGVRRIYPTLSDTQLEFYILDLVNSSTDLWQHCAELNRTLASLNQALQLWRSEGGLLAAVRRRRVATLLRRCWRRKLVNYANEYILNIQGERVGSLPSLPAEVDFSHVQRLILRDMDLASLDEDFLRRFSQITELDLRNNRLSEIPAGLEHLTQLRMLNLSHNRIVITELSSQRLSQLSHLRILSLSHNPLGRAPRLASLNRLSHLSLRATGLEALPDLTETLPWRAHLDLRDNRITQLRQHVLDLWHDLQRVSLHDNPLEPESVHSHDRLSQASATGSRRSLQHAHLSISDRVLDQWIGSTTTAERARRTQLWNELSAEEGASDLFRFLADFTVTDEFEQRPGHYQGRVWHLLEAAHGHEQLRARLFETAAGERTCEDRLLLVMSQLELSVMVECAVIDGPVEHVEKRLLELERSLFRLDALDEIATRHIEYMREARPRHVDEIEVRLYYRVMLRQELGLPAMPDAMHYSEFANVSRKDLRRAASAVLAVETPEALAASLAQRPFWQRFVRSRYAKRFEALTTPFYERLEALEAQALDSAQWVESSNRLKEELDSAEQALIRTLADEAYARTAGSTPPTMVSGAGE